MIPFPVFVILKLKTFGWCARQQSLQTPQVTNTRHAMPERALKASLTSKSWLRFVFNTKLMYHHYTWRLIGILLKLKKKKTKKHKPTNQPTVTRSDYFKIHMCVLWLARYLWWGPEHDVVKGTAGYAHHCTTRKVTWMNNSQTKGFVCLGYKNITSTPMDSMQVQRIQISHNFQKAWQKKFELTTEMAKEITICFKIIFFKHGEMFFNLI